MCKNCHTSSAFALSRIDHCSSLLFRSTRDVTSHSQLMLNYAARVILRLPKSSKHTFIINPLDSCQCKKHIQNRLFVLPLPQQYCTIICHRHAYGKPSHTRNSSSCTMPFLNCPAHSKATLLVARFHLLLLPSGTIFQMMSDVLHHCHHLSLV